MKTRLIRSLFQTFSLTVTPGRPPTGSRRLQLTAQTVEALA